LAGVILSLKAIGIKDVSKIDFVDRPSDAGMLEGFRKLVKIGAINSTNGELT
jgi:HrpA-like RNA helicase